MAGEVWECEFQGRKSYGAYGPRDVLLVWSSDNMTGPGIVTRKNMELTAEDRDRLDSEGISQRYWEDEELLLKARYGKDSRYKTISVLGGAPCEEVLEKIKTTFQSTQQPGVTVHYFGPGKWQTGDWCFHDGFITFTDIANLYQGYFSGKVLEVYCDCSYSGMWVEACRRFLDDSHTQPCGHSARKTDMLLKIRASCLADQLACTLTFSVRGCGNDKNQKSFYMNESTQLCEDQTTCDVDSTLITCGQHPSVECRLHPEFTYHRKLSYAKRLDIATQIHQGKKAWYLILLDDDQEKIREYRQKTQGECEAINLTEFGRVIQSGWGEEPPTQFVRDICIGIKHIYIN